MNKCQEKYYIRKLVVWLIGFNVYGLVIYAFLNPMFRFMPILESDSCLLLVIKDLGENNRKLTPQFLTTNTYMFLVFNWLELAVLYFTWRQLKWKYTVNNRLNIKMEMLTAVACWCTITLTQLTFTSFRDSKYINDENTNHPIWDYLPFFCIIARDLCTFYAQTLFTVAQLGKDLEDEKYHINDNLVSNISMMSLDVVMTHKTTFKYFNDYVEQRVQNHVVYLNLYKSIQIYKMKIKQLVKLVEQYKGINGSDHNVDSKEQEEKESQLGQLQQMIGKLMIMILEHLKENQAGFPKILITEFISSLQDS